MVFQYDGIQYSIDDSKFGPDTTLADLGLTVATVADCEKNGVYLVADLANIDLAACLSAYARYRFERLVILSGFAVPCNN